MRVCTSVICLLSLWFLCVWWKININLTYCPRLLPYVKLNVEKQLSSLKLKQSERQFRKLQFLTWHFLPCVFKTKLKNDLKILYYTRRINCRCPTCAFFVVKLSLDLCVLHLWWKLALGSSISFVCQERLQGLGEGLVLKVHIFVTS